MNLIIFKLLILGVLILMITLYLYVIINSRNNIYVAKTFTKDNFDITQQPLSTQLIDQIAVKLSVSVRRIQNLKYSGDVSKQLLMVSFTILDPNMIETANGEPNSQTAAVNANNLFSQNTFVVQINGVNVKLTKINAGNSNIPTATQDNSVYFNNTGLVDISNYAQQKYIDAPLDKSLTQYYTLQYDKTFNLKPILE